MKNHIKKIALVFIISAASTAWGVSPYVEKAQQAFLNKEPLAVMSNIHLALRGPKLSASETKNLMGLYEKTLADERGRADLGWSLPPEVLRMRVSVDYRDESIEKKYTLILSGSTSLGTRIKSFVLKRYPDLAVIDKENNIGAFIETLKPNENYYYARTRGQTLPIPAGAYLLNFTLDSGVTTSGWFYISDDMNSPATPEFVGLQNGQVINNGTPTFSWKLFNSPNYQAGEKKQVVFSINKIDSDGNWKVPDWMLYQDNMQATSVDLAKDTPSEPPNIPLADGPYMTMLSYKDYKMVSPIKLMRTSMVMKRVTVKK